MKTQIILPFEYAPECVSYQYIAFPLGIIQGNAKRDFVPWLSGQYINCWFSPTSPCNFAFFDMDNWAIENEILFHQQINLSRDQFDSIIGCGLISMFKKMIDLGYYPSGIYNEEFIPGKRSFHNHYSAHDFILLGYNDNTQTFISAGYLANKKYQQFSIPYGCMSQAVTTLCNDKIVFDFWKYNPNATYTLNCHKMALGLKDYLNSSNSQPLYVQDATWGLQALIDTGKFIIDYCEKENYIDHRCTRAVMEFKKLMHMRIHYLLSCDILEDWKYLDCAYDALRLSEVSHLLGVKFRLKKEKRIAYTINDIYHRVVSLENTYLPSVLSDIQHRIH